MWPTIPWPNSRRSERRSSNDQNSDRTTLLWDGSGQRTAVVNAQGQRTTTLYNAIGQFKREEPAASRAAPWPLKYGKSTALSEPITIAASGSGPGSIEYAANLG